MPRPVLSETTFNSDNIATSILSQANLQVANSNLGVTDITSNFFSVQSGWTLEYSNVFTFNSIVFFQLTCPHTGTPAIAEHFASIQNSDYYPTKSNRFVTSSFEGDTAWHVELTTSGQFKIRDPEDPGSSGLYYIMVTGAYLI